MRIFGESVRKARKEHFCDFCCNWIEPGQMYRRVIWVSHTGAFQIMKEHDSCPENEFERTLQREQECMSNVSVRQEKVIELQRNGPPIVRQALEAVPVLVAEDDPPANDDEEEIPF